MWKYIALLYHFQNRRRYNIEVWPSVKLKGTIYIPHNIGIEIGRTAVLGNNVWISPNVVVGSRKSPYGDEGEGVATVRRHADIGDNCLLGAGALIMGSITIGANTTIAAGAIVTKDIPENSIVTGVNLITKKDMRRVKVHDITWV
jgi:serine O-acetyltransferase